MSNNAHVNDDEIEIHQLPEVTALQSGMMVAVDSQPTGTKCFNLTTALEGKASTSDVTDLATAVAGKAEASDLTALATTVEGKADASDVTALETAMEGKADASTTYTKTEVDQAITGIKAVPASTPSDEGRVLSVDASGDATWGTIREVPEVLQSDIGKVLKVDSNSDPVWATVKELPASETTDIGKVLSVDSTGNPTWETVSSNAVDGGNKTESDVVNGKITVTAPNSDTKISLSTMATLTIVSNSGVPDFSYDIDNTGNSNNVSITVKDSTEGKTLLHPVAGNTIGAGKYVHIQARGNCWTSNEMYIDIYNPLGLPDRTIRIQMSSSSDDPSTIFTYCQGPSLTFTRVDGTTDQWDCHYDSSDWYGLFRLNTNSNKNKLIKVLGANTTTVTGMDYMFGKSSYDGNAGLREIALFDTANVTTMRYMLAGCSSLQSIPAFDLTNVTTILNICEDCTSLSSILLKNTSNVTNMGYAFRHTAITSLPDIDTSSATDTKFMFCDCSNLTDISLPTDFVFTHVTDCSNMFKDCPYVNTGILNTYNTMSSASISSYSLTFNNCGTQTTTGQSELAQIPSAWK